MRRIDLSESGIRKRDHSESKITKKEIALSESNINL
jgi:hypothetical protein